MDRQVLSSKGWTQSNVHTRHHWHSTTTTTRSAPTSWLRLVLCTQPCVARGGDLFRRHLCAMKGCNELPAQIVPTSEVVRQEPTIANDPTFGGLELPNCCLVWMFHQLFVAQSVGCLQDLVTIPLIVEYGDCGSSDDEESL